MGDPETAGAASKVRAAAVYARHFQACVCMPVWFPGSAANLTALCAICAGSRNSREWTRILTKLPGDCTISLYDYRQCPTCACLLHVCLVHAYTCSRPRANIFNKHIPNV